MSSVNRSPRPTPGSGDMIAQAELGIWLSGIESFLGTSAHPFAEKFDLRAQDWSSELRLARSGLLYCSRILVRPGLVAESPAGAATLSVNDRDDLATVIRDAGVLADGLLRAGPLGWNEWRSWSRLVVENLQHSSSFERAVSISETAADDVIPDRFKEIVADDAVAFSDRIDLENVVDGFARILRSLAVVERMLQDDEPLKPALLIFARIYEDTHELVTYINHRLIRFRDEDAELFRMLDSASYTASIELRKVFDQELAGLPAVRSAVTVFARIETAYATLRDGIHQILIGIARMIRPEVAAFDIFPYFKIKLEESIRLRDELAAVLKAVRAAEQQPDSGELSPARLKKFVDGPVQTLFYKDRESVERFVEEILRMPERKDLVPTLHRFGAYLETLFTHVNNRTVLADHPFSGTGA